PPQGALAYLDTNVSPFTMMDVAKLELKVSNGPTFVVQREQEKDKAKEKEKKAIQLAPDTGWLLLEPKNFKDRPHADRDQVDTVLMSLTGMGARKWVKKVGAKADLSEYGLKAPAVVASLTLKPEGDKKEGKT